MINSQDAKKQPVPTASERSHIYLLVLGFTLALFGILMIYSASALYAERLYSNELYFIKRHLAHVAVGFITFLVMSRLDYRILRKLVLPMMLISMLLLALVLVPYIGVKVYGARRWISLYFFTFQPSELFKVVTLIWIADFLSRKQEEIVRFSRSLLPLLLILGIYLLLLLLQPDYGSAALVVMTLLVVTLIAGVPFVHLISVMSLVMVVFIYLAVESAYRLKRIQAFMDPWSDMADSGYQLGNSLIAYGGGGLLGRGFGESLQKRLYLPQAHTDFISAVIGEEIGLFGFSIFLCLLTMFFMTGFNIARRAKDRFGQYLAFGIAIMLALQSLFHIFVTLGLLPPKGIGLPLISYGGTLTVVSFALIGILYSIGVRSRTAT